MGPPRRVQHIPTPHPSALDPRIVAVALGVDEVAGILRAEDDLSTATSVTDTMIRVIAHGGRGVARRHPYGESATSARSEEMIVTLTDGNATTVGSPQGSTTLISDQLVQRSPACALSIHTVALAHQTPVMFPERLQVHHLTLPIMFLRQTEQGRKWTLTHVVPQSL
jgi:hypothetical protein